MSYHIICDDFYEHFLHRHFLYFTRSKRSGFSITNIVLYFFWSVISYILYIYSSQYTKNDNSPTIQTHTQPMNMKHEKVDFIFSTFIFVNVVTHLMKHINFVAAMTREIFFRFSVSRSLTSSSILFGFFWNRCLFICFTALVRFFARQVEWQFCKCFWLLCKRYHRTEKIETVLNAMTSMAAL